MTYLRPTAPIAADVLLPGDPAVAMALAQQLIDGPLMANHAYGLWGYSGTAHTGHPLTIQSTGIGAASAAAVIAELAEHGARRAIRLGHATALDDDQPADAIVVGAAIRAEGGGPAAVETPDPALTARLSAALGRPARTVTVASRRLPGAPGKSEATALRASGASLLDLETEAAFLAASRAGVAIAAALLVGTEGAGEAHESPLLELGARCVAALGADQSSVSETASLR